MFAWEGEEITEGDEETLRSDRYAHHYLIVVMASWVYTCVKTYQMVL